MCSLALLFLRLVRSSFVLLNSQRVQHDLVLRHFLLSRLLVLAYIPTPCVTLRASMSSNPNCAGTSRPHWQFFSLKELFRARHVAGDAAASSDAACALPTAVPDSTASTVCRGTSWDGAHGHGIWNLLPNPHECASDSGVVDSNADRLRKRQRRSGEQSDARRLPSRCRVGSRRHHLHLAVRSDQRRALQSGHFTRDGHLATGCIFCAFAASSVYHLSIRRRATWRVHNDCSVIFLSAFIRGPQPDARAEHR